MRSFAASCYGKFKMMLLTASAQWASGLLWELATNLLGLKRLRKDFGLEGGKE